MSQETPTPRTDERLLRALTETADQLEDLIEATEGLHGLDSFQQDALANSRVVLGRVARPIITAFQP